MTLELENLGSWGPDCELAQVYDQARQAAVSRISRAFASSDPRINPGVRILGPVTVTAITTDLEKRG